MDIHKDIGLIVTTALLLFAISLIILVLFGTIASHISTGGNWAQWSSYKAAGSFAVGTQEGDFGELGESQLERDMIETGGYCRLDLNGFGEDELLRIDKEGKDCGTLILPLKIPLYSGNEFYSVTIGGGILSNVEL